MGFLIYFFTTLYIYNGAAEIRDSIIVNKLVKIKPVGASISKNFVPLTEIPPPHTPHVHADGRRHLDIDPDDCTKRAPGEEVWEGGKVIIGGDYYDDRVVKTVATVIIPDHIDHKHFEVTTSMPYLTVGSIEAIGYHPTTLKSEHPAECEKIYQDHVAEQYSDETTDYSEESLEMARMPLFPEEEAEGDNLKHLDEMYGDDLSM